MAALSKVSWRTADNAFRFSGFRKDGYTGNHVHPTTYSAYAGDFPPLRQTDGHSYSIVDIPNEVPATRSIANFPHARNKAWGDLVGKVRSDPASLGTALAEWPEALGMIAGRASQLYRGYKHLRHGRFRPFLRTFGIGPKRKHRNLIKNKIGDASSLWLEYSFGWKPLTQDIYDACTTLGKPVPSGSASGSGSEAFSYRYSTGNNRVHKDFSGVAKVKQGADFYVTSPNLYLAQQLGIANPLSIAWELVPFSFMVDWVFDIGSFIGGFSDLLGMTVLHPYTSFFLKVRGHAWEDWGPNGPQNQPGWIYRMTRTTSLSAPVPNFSFTANVGQSMTRAANAVSLLGQILAKH